MGAFINEHEDYVSLAAAVHQNGFAFLKTRLSEDGCEQVKGFIDAYPQDKAEINYGGSEKRIWGAQTGNDTVQAFADLSDQLMARVFKAKTQVKTVLAYSNYPIPPEDRLRTGRWHLDSLRPQFKLFCFLTQTREETGPLELVRGTHASDFKLWPLLTGKYIAPQDVGTPHRRYQRLDEAWVTKQCERRGSVPMLCDAGALVLVNTSAIHRARPCLEGHRYALCAYYDHF